MSKKRKKYDGNRNLRLVCLDHQTLCKECVCGGDKWTWILVNEKEFKHFQATGLVPDWRAELFWADGQPKPKPRKVEFPPKFSFMNTSREV